MQNKIKADEPSPVSTPLDVLTTFLKLGLTSFGGPVAHIGYYRIEFVEKKRWLTESQFAQLLAICQFLPGPASSQFGFSVGLLRAGWLGAVAAFVAFTLPSALLLFGFAALLPYLSGDIGSAAIHGLKIVALAFVTHAVFSMNRQLCPDPARQTLAVLAAATVLVAGTAQLQFLVIVLGAVAGLFVSPQEKPVAGENLEPRYGMTTGWLLLTIFAALLVIVMTASDRSDDALSVFGAFYQAGALVFGGGHVVLPLLEETVVTPGWISAEDFLAGYGAAQAVPGPLFSVAAYLGAQLPGNSGGVSGAALAVVAIFLPGFLLVAGVLPLWRFVSERPGASRAIAGANAAVVGLLAAALYDPVFTSAVTGPTDFAIGLIAILLLGAWRRSPLVVVAWCVVASIAAAAVQQI